VGFWTTGKGNTKIEIIETDSTYEFKIISSENSNAPIGKDIKFILA